MDEADEVQVIPLNGFDPDGEPELRRMTDGSLWLVLNFLPPSWLQDRLGPGDLGPCESFDRQLEGAVGSAVTWEDREFFRIAQPRPDTAERVQRFLAEFRQRHNPGTAEDA
jgi:hypothetical protein